MSYRVRYTKAAREDLRRLYAFLLERDLTRTFHKFDQSHCRSGLGRDSSVGSISAVYRGQGRSYRDTAIFMKHSG